MFRYALRRILLAIPTLFGAMLLTFVLFSVVGGSPAEIELGKNATVKALAEYDHTHGYDLPVFFGFSRRVPRVGAIACGLAQNADEGEPAGVAHFPYGLPEGEYELRSGSGAFRFSTIGKGRVDSVDGVPFTGGCTLWRRFRNPFKSQFSMQLMGLLRGDFGESTEYKMPVAQVLRDGVWVSLSLTVPILVVGSILALLVGALCAAARGGLFDRVALGVTTALMSVNYVVWVIVGQYLLAYRWRIFPLWGYESFSCLILPIIIGVISSLGHDTRFYRSVMLDEANSPHVRTAVAKGLSRPRIIWRHIFRNSLVSVTTNISLSIPFLFTGSVLLESFFGLPGLGGVGVNAVHSADVAMLRAVVLVGAFLYQAANVLADLAYAWFDPRVRIA